MRRASSFSLMKRHGGGRLVAVDGDAHQLRAGAGKGCDLRHRAVDIGGVGIGHRLDDDRRVAADQHLADADGDGGAAARQRAGGEFGTARISFMRDHAYGDPRLRERAWG